MVKTYRLDIDIERISNGFNVKVDSSDQDGLNKFYPNQSDMINDLKAHFESKLNVLEQEYQNYLSRLLLPGDLSLRADTNINFNLSWVLRNEDLIPKNYEIEYQINDAGWLANAMIEDKGYWGEARRRKWADLKLPEPLATGDTIEFRVRGTHDGFPPSAWSESVSYTYNG